MKPQNANQLAAWADVPAKLATLTAMGASKYGFPLDVLRGECRKRPIVRCRCWIARRARLEGFSFPQIGRALNRDHTSVIHLVRAGLVG